MKEKQTYNFSKKEKKKSKHTKQGRGGDWRRLLEFLTCFQERKGLGSGNSETIKGYFGDLLLMLRFPRLTEVSAGWDARPRRLFERLHPTVCDRCSRGRTVVGPVRFG
jgi:hypothetical protein